MNIYEFPGGPNIKYRATLVAKSHVIVERFEGDTMISMKKFEIGDQAEYDSFNLHYYGPIVAIGNKTVSVKTTSNKVKRMNPDNFGYRNWDFDASKVDAQNHETMMYI